MSDAVLGFGVIGQAAMRILQGRSRDMLLVPPDHPPPPRPMLYSCIPDYFSAKDDDEKACIKHDGIILSKTLAGKDCCYELVSSCDKK